MTGRADRAAAAAAELLAPFGQEVPGSGEPADWSSCGARALTPRGAEPPGDVPARLHGAALALGALSNGLLDVDGPGQLSLRERLSEFKHEPREGRTLRGAGRMLSAADGWLAVNLPRPSDEELLPALTEGAAADGDIGGLAAWLADRPSQEVVDRATLLGLAVSRVGEAAQQAPPRPWRVRDVEAARPRGGHMRVLDLSSLWAGPLAGALLAEAGAEVVKLESTARRETPAAGDERFFRHLNGGKKSLVLDFADRPKLHAAVAEADVVIVASRPRALAALGLTRSEGQLWLAITAHRHGIGAENRVGFGDDAAAAAGVVGWADGRPEFCADALADPVTGLLAAVAALGFSRAGLAGRVELTLEDGAAWAACDDGGGEG